MEPQRGKRFNKYRWTTAAHQDGVIRTRFILPTERTNKQPLPPNKQKCSDYQERGKNKVGPLISLSCCHERITRPWYN